MSTDALPYIAAGQRLSTSMFTAACRPAGPSTRRAPARGCAAKHKSLDVDAMLHVVSDGNSDTGSAVDHADDDTTMDGDRQADDLPYADNDQVRTQQCSV